MKRSERRIMTIFSDNNLHADPRFKRSLKEAMMKKMNQKQQPSYRKPLVLATAGVAAVAVLFVAAQLVPSGGNGSGSDDGNKVAIPFTPQTASAARLSELSKASVEKLKSGDVPLLIRTERLEQGPLFAACSTGLMGATPGETTEYYAFMAKESGAEAFYQVAKGETTREFSYYNANGSQLSGVLDFLVGHPFSLEGYTQVDAQGQPTSADVTSKKQDSRGVFHVYATVPGSGDMCQGQPVVYDFAVDADKYTLIETARYAGAVAADNLISRHVSDLETRNLNEDEALRAMEKAGFDKDQAVSELPARISL